MVEFTNAGNTGGYIVPDDAAPIFAPHFAAEGFFQVQLHLRGGETPQFRELWDRLRFELAKQSDRIAARMATLEQDRFLAVEPECNPLGLFASDSDEPIIVEAS